MTAGIYALDNGYDVTIVEKHIIAGGQCTGWVRKETFIDGCAHWIVGTNPKSQLNPLWRHIGAIDDNTAIHDTEYFTKFYYGDEIVTIYADLDKLKEEFLRVAPEDKRQINSFIRAVKAYRHVKIPVKKPLDKMNFFELTHFGIGMLPMAFQFAIAKHTSSVKYAMKFKSPILRYVFNNILGADYNIHSFFYVMQALSLHDAGMIEGGSKAIADRVRRRFLDKGGNLVLGNGVEKIIIEDNTAKGVLLKDGKTIYSDYVISSCDAYHTLNVLLEGKYHDRFFKDRFDNLSDYPINACMLVCYRTKKNVDNVPKMICYRMDKPFVAGTNAISVCSIRNHSFDKTLNKEWTSINVLLQVDDGAYRYLKGLNRADYLAFKKNAGEVFAQHVAKAYGIDPSDLDLIDVTTPLTYERYVNSYHGSYMSFIITSRSHGLMGSGVIKGLKNFVMCGQWLMPPGGLPVALFTGKHAAARICYMDRKKFLNFERKLYASVSKS
ncbi:MAG: FAD-dependent oxidoreductase [Bacilli bacterium]|nr:FAD-dependent oxidoreductase [Bacilli bacterium]